LGQGDLSASVKTVEALGAETVVELEYNGIEMLCLYQGSFDGQEVRVLNLPLINLKFYFLMKREIKCYECQFFN